MAFVRRHMLNEMKRGFVIAQNCRFPWLAQKNCRLAGSLAYAQARKGEPEVRKRQLVTNPILQVISPSQWYGRHRPESRLMFWLLRRNR